MQSTHSLTHPTIRRTQRKSKPIVALIAPDRDKFIAAIRSLIKVTKTLIPIHRDATGNFPTNTLKKHV